MTRCPYMRNPSCLVGLTIALLFLAACDDEPVTTAQCDVCSCEDAGGDVGADAGDVTVDSAQPEPDRDVDAEVISASTDLMTTVRGLLGDDGIFGMVNPSREKTGEDALVCGDNDRGCGDIHVACDGRDITGATITYPPEEECHSQWSPHQTLSGTVTITLGSGVSPEHAIFFEGYRRGSMSYSGELTLKRTGRGEYSLWTGSAGVDVSKIVWFNTKNDGSRFSTDQKGSLINATQPFHDEVLGTG